MILVTRFLRACKDLWTNTFHKDHLQQIKHLEERVKVQEEFRMVKHLECFLRRLGVKEYTIIQLDWGDHEEWQWRSYKDRVIANESQRAQARIDTVPAGSESCGANAEHQLADSTGRTIKEESDNEGA